MCAWSPWFSASWARINSAARADPRVGMLERLGQALLGQRVLAREHREDRPRERQQRAAVALAFDPLAELGDRRVAVRAVVAQRP